MAVIPCAPVTITTGIVTFVPAAFVAAYPEFTGIPASQLTQAFNLATTILNNTCCSRIKDANLRDTLLQMLTAHITFLLSGTNDGGYTVPTFQGVGSVTAGVLNVTGILSQAAPLAVGSLLGDMVQGLAPGSVITALGTGTGGVGTYTISPTQDVASETFLVPGLPQITPAPGIVGRINTASEGSVSVGAEYGGDGGPNQDWYTSSRYGALYWMQTRQYRTALYLPALGSFPPNFPAGYPGYGGAGFLPGGGGCGC